MGASFDERMSAATSPSSTPMSWAAIAMYTVVHSAFQNTLFGWNRRCQTRCQSTAASIIDLLLEQGYCAGHPPLGDDLLHRPVRVELGESFLHRRLQRVAFADGDPDREWVDRRAADLEGVVAVRVVDSDRRVAEVRVDPAGLERRRGIGVFREGDDADRFLPRLY